MVPNGQVGYTEYDKLASADLACVEWRLGIPGPEPETPHKF